MPDEEQPATTAEPTATFLVHRELLFSVVYAMLGSAADTDEVLQETWLAWVARNHADRAPIENPRAYLTRIAVNQALAQRAALDRRRETYVGQWLPEPLASRPADDGDAADAVLRPASSRR